jgi:hypothetical protein
MTTFRTLQPVKAALRAGPYAWPGGYPLFFLASDGAALSFDAVRDMFREIVAAHLRPTRGDGWLIDGVDINWEDASLTCAHTGKLIHCAYGEEEEDA